MLCWEHHSGNPENILDQKLLNYIFVIQNCYDKALFSVIWFQQPLTISLCHRGHSVSIRIAKVSLTVLFAGYVTLDTRDSAAYGFVTYHA